MKRRARHGSPGFALLMAILLIAITGFLLVGLARRSISITMRSAELQDELRLRWGVRTLERSIAQQVEPLLTAGLDGSESQAAVLPLEGVVDISGIRLRVLLDDETRKLNLNRAYALRGLKGVQQSMSHLGLGDVCAHMPVTQTKVRFFLESWGQVFSPEVIPARQEPWDYIRSRTVAVTLWGGGKLHFRRTSDMVIEAACLETLSPNDVAKFLALRASEPQLELKELLERLSLRDVSRSRLQGFFADDSSCYSIWLTASTERRQLKQLSILDRSGQPLTKFRW